MLTASFDQASSDSISETAPLVQSRSELVLLRHSNFQCYDNLRLCLSCWLTQFLVCHILSHIRGESLTADTRRTHTVAVSECSTETSNSIDIGQTVWSCVVVSLHVSINRFGTNFHCNSSDAKLIVWTKRWEQLCHVNAICCWTHRLYPCQFWQFKSSHPSVSSDLHHFIRVIDTVS